MRKRKDRKKTLQEVSPVLHVFCEGEKTEPNYLVHYKDLFCKNGIAIRIERTSKNTPVQLVQEAVRLKKVNPAGDVYWVVYDRESQVKYSEALHARARDLAARNDIYIALSNVCFEVWLLLHYQSTCAACNTCDELLARSDFKAAFPGYEKGAGCVLSAEQIALARMNAEKLNKRTISGANKEWNFPSMWNPYTNVYELLDAIDRFDRQRSNGMPHVGE